MFVRSILVTKLVRILMILNQNTLARNPGKRSQNINVRKLFKGGNYMRKYGSYFISFAQMWPKSALRWSKGGQNVIIYYCLSNVDFTLNDRQDDKGPSLYYVISVTAHQIRA